ncbi:MAG: peptidylprolyl isomerase [Rhodocyclales bacterium]|nr:peptidylprolyl isomerase [Rhodocyclales bacterium]
MTRPIHATLLAAALIALTSAAQAAPPAKQVATVNGKPIPQTRFDTIINSQMAQGQPDTPQLRDAVKERLIRIELLAQEAEKKGMDKKPAVAAQIAMTRQDVLIGAYLQDYVKAHPVTDDMVKAEYENLRKTLGEKEYKARHILVESEDEAKAIIGKLKAGEKFEELAKQSKDPGSKERGGDLGWSNKASYVKPFSDAMSALEKGKTTETPVKSDFGYHVIQLEDVRDMKAPALDEIKPQLTQRLQQQMIEKHINDLRAKAKVQ